MPSGESVALATVFLGAGAFLATIGYFVRYRRAMWLIAGYDPASVADEAGLARFVGGGALLLGVLHLALAVAAWTASIPDVAWLVLALVVPASVAVLVLGARRYRIDTDADAGES